ncbi:MAG TPA: Uma2 family endonuclease [Beijerinckiaceae bacterium]|jgi:Uma2 family endonuclease
MSRLSGIGPGPFTVATFHEWLESRSEEEHWELIEGIAVMNAAPLVGHQRIASNFEFHLRDALAKRKPEWMADREIGIELSDDSPFRPEPEIAVVDAEIDTTRRGLDRFYLVVEVRSVSDRPRVFQPKLDFYRDHPHNRWIVIVEQARIEATIHERQADGTWAERVVNRPTDVLSFGEIGEVCALGDLYKNTNLDPARRRDRG